MNINGKTLDHIDAQGESWVQVNSSLKVGTQVVESGKGVWHAFLHW